MMLTHSCTLVQTVLGRLWAPGTAGTRDVTEESQGLEGGQNAFASSALQVRREFGLQKVHFHSSLEPVRVSTRLLAVVD